MLIKGWLDGDYEVYGVVDLACVAPETRYMVHLSTQRSFDVNAIIKGAVTMRCYRNALRDTSGPERIAFHLDRLLGVARRLSEIRQRYRLSGTAGHQ